MFPIRQIERLFSAHAKDPVRAASCEDIEFVSEPENNIEADPFMHSLETITADDIAPPLPPKKPTREQILSEVIRRSILFICVCAFIGSLGYIGYTLYQYSVAEKYYAAIQDDFLNFDEIATFNYDADNEVAGSPHSPRSDLSMSMTAMLSNKSDTESDNETTGSTSSESYNAILEQMRSKINYYKKINDDVKGYIYIPDTKISYLYVQGEDNTYYLNNTYEGDFMPAGSIFADYRCLDPLLRNFNFILYGHNMQNGLMFNGLTEFLDEQFFEDHPYVFIYTLDGIFTYEIFSIRKVSMYDDYIRTAFYNSEEFKEFAYRMQDESLYLRNGGLDFNDYDRILTLSTCTTNFHTTERYTLQAKLINVES